MRTGIWVVLIMVGAYFFTKGIGFLEYIVGDPFHWYGFGHNDIVKKMEETVKIENVKITKEEWELWRKQMENLESVKSGYKIVGTVGIIGLVLVIPITLFIFYYFGRL